MSMGEKLKVFPVLCRAVGRVSVKVGGGATVRDPGKKGTWQTREEGTEKRTKGGRGTSAKRKNGKYRGRGWGDNQLLLYRMKERENRRGDESRTGSHRTANPNNWDPKPLRSKKEGT